MFTDKASGKDTQRPQLEALLSFVREGDTVVVHSMDRLARNLDDLRRLVQKLTQRGVRIEFSPTGVSADTVVQKLCIEAREEGRACSVVSSDGTIQAVVMGKGVTRISSRMLVDEIKQIDNDVHEAEEAPQIKMTLGSRLSPDALAKLKALRGR